MCDGGWLQGLMTVAGKIMSALVLKREIGEMMNNGDNAVKDKSIMSPPRPLAGHRPSSRMSY